MQDAIAEFFNAPRWAQITMAAFALLVIWSVAGSFVTKHRFRGRFRAIAKALGAPVPRGLRWPITFPVTIDERGFEVRHALMYTSKNSTYRGPQGHLLITATRLEGDRWPLHQVDISTIGKLLSLLARGVPATTGDPDFDARFLVRESGTKVREGWLDADVRRQVIQLYGGIPSNSLIAIQDGELRVTVREPWTGVDGAVRSLLERQLALAVALERTSSSRF